MKLTTPIVLLITSLFPVLSSAQSKPAPENFVVMLDGYYDEGARLSPVFATVNGDNRFNDQLPVDFTDSYRKTLIAYNKKFLTRLLTFNRQHLNQNDQLSYDILKWRLETTLKGLSLRDNRMPFNQFQGLPQFLAQLGSGTTGQPFKTVKDYDNWLKRAGAFAAWSDSAILYFRKGMKEQIVLPKVLVLKMIPQLESMIADDPRKSIFYGPVNNMPADFPDADKARLASAYTTLIRQTIVPSYKKLADFLKTEYLPVARSSSGWSALPDGKKMYAFQVLQITTTQQTPEDIYQTGLKEVKRIKGEMEKVKAAVGFSGDLNAFFHYLQTDPKFFPYKTPDEVLTDYRSIEPKIAAVLKKMFLHSPKTGFEVRATEAFRAATSAAQYFPGAPDGSRPGIFYVPIVDATKTVTARESLFIHEAVPGHHYQVMLQRENDSLPAFRRFGGFTAYIEGWGLYAESLGKELGLYKDPYQYMRALGDEIHRAIRLVVDVGLHEKGWTREQAIQYTIDNEPVEEQRAISETERYMAIPAQALAYKTGGLKIQALRAKYEKQLGSRFNIAAFHDAILKDGSLPLDILERKMDA